MILVNYVQPLLARVSFSFLGKLLYIKPHSELVKNNIQVLCCNFLKRKGVLNYNDQNQSNDSSIEVPLDISLKNVSIISVESSIVYF